MNKVFLSGNLTRNPECGKTKSGISYCRFSIAVQKNYSNADGEKEVDFFNCIAWRNTAEYCGNYLEKGKRVTIEGELSTGSYTAQDGTNRQSVNIVVSNIEIAFAKPSESEKREQESTADIKPVENEGLPF